MTNKQAESNQPCGGEVLPKQCCNCFSPRKSITLPRRECWYCRYADFNLSKPSALKVGRCCYPSLKSK